MPTYEYRCRECGDTLEVVQSFTDDSLTECPACKGELKKVFSAVGISFKGDGFYKTDSRVGASKSNGTSSSKDGDSGSSSPKDGESGSSSSDSSSKESSSSSKSDSNGSSDKKSSSSDTKSSSPKKDAKKSSSSNS